MKPNVNVDAQPKDPISYQKLENLAQKLSAIFLKYPALYNTYVNIHCKNSDIYRLNTEGIKQKACNGYAEISVHANVRTSSGSTLNDRYYRMVTSDKELDEAALIADIEKFAERLMEVKQATPLNDFISVRCSSRAMLWLRLWLIISILSSFPTDLYRKTAVWEALFGASASSIRNSRSPSVVILPTTRAWVFWAIIRTMLTD